MFTGNSINKETLCDGIRYIPFKGETPFRWWLGESGKFYLCNVTNLLATKDCITFQVNGPLHFPLASGKEGVSRSAYSPQEYCYSVRCSDSKA